MRCLMKTTYRLKSFYIAIVILKFINCVLLFHFSGGENALSQQFMNFVQGLRSPLSLAGASSLFPSLTLRWCFWQSQKKLTKSAQRAVWATQIIKTIEQSEPPKSIAQPSLRQRILKLQVPSQDYAFDPECKKEVLQLFEGGIYLNPKVFQQGRIKMAEQPQSKKEVNELHSTMTQSNTSQRKFIFCPNSLVTRHIFNYMGRSQTNNFFISGGYGISKTISIILYLHLSNFITTYFCEASRPNPSATQGQSEQDQVDKAEEMKDLQTKQLLREKSYKYFYWSIDTSHYRIKDIIKTLVLEQAHQLSSKERQALVGHDDFGMCLQEFYPSNVRVRSIVDQINTLAQLLRIINYQKEKISKMTEGRIKTQKMLDFQLKLISGLRLRRYLQQFVSLGNHFGVNSSEAIQKQMLKTSYDKKQSLNFCLEDRQVLTYYRVPYEKAVSSPEGANEFKQLIWFEIERRLSSCQTNQYQISSIKKKFYEEVAANIPITGFAKFLTIRQLLEKENLFKNIRCVEQEKQFVKSLKQTLQQLKSKGLETEKAIFKKMFDKSKLEEKLIIENLHQIAEMHMLDDDKRHRLFTFRSKDIEVDPKLNGYNLAEKLQDKYMNSSEFQEKLPYELLQDGLICLPWTVQQFLVISSETLYPEIAKECQKMLSQSENDVIRNYGVVKEMCFMAQLKKCLIKGSRVKIEIITQNDQKGDILANLETTKVQHVTKFHHFNKSEPTMSFVDHNFKLLLEMAQNYPNEACVAIPHYTDLKGQYVFSYESKEVDFIICRYGLDKVFHISMYDTIVSKYLRQKQNSHEAFYKEHIFYDMKKFKIPANRFSFRHIILGPRESCKKRSKVQIDNYSYALQYGDALSLMIFDCKDEEAQQRLREIQRIAKIHLQNTPSQ